MAQYIDKAALLAEIDRQKIGYNTDGKHSVEYDITKKIIDVINNLEVKEFQKKNLYVVTRCEEHSDYVEKAFFSKKKAEEYCKQFEGNEDAYSRDITEIKVDCSPFEMKWVELEDSIKETLAQKYIDYTFKRHNIDPNSKEGQLIYYAYMHGMNQCLNQLKAQKGE